MQQSEVIQQALREAPPSPAAHEFTERQPGEKVIRAHDLGDVDVDLVGAWIAEQGGRVLQLGGELHWVISEAAITL